MNGGEDGERKGGRVAVGAGEQGGALFGMTQHKDCSLFVGCQGNHLRRVHTSSFTRLSGRNDKVLGKK
ncbi:hypothetical protein E2C01_094396 [Portunus trituberculatus]|uniref:Uncharacterized protein n=1 Tax=Portunus trituberculatus TaxID=210409 RepID=A0A5B7K353_PORTR|nr:hypothetical protein [Portunus trituberculatus]